LREEPVRRDDRFNEVPPVRGFELGDAKNDEGVKFSERGVGRVELIGVIDVEVVGAVSEGEEATGGRLAMVWRRVWFFSG